MSNKENYIINMDKKLGVGVTAEVFLGMRRSDGLLCAMKCSMTNFQKGSKKAFQNEANIMKELDHENIIKFYDDLSDFSCQNKVFARVIVMEYCNRGSLYDFAEVHKGLCDNMFLTVLDCLNEGLKYLRKRDYTHRDIKPGNMMVHQDHMGYYHVKLGDLGTAKQVQADQMFTTLCGTVEYLHPDMLIEQLDPGHQSGFKVNVDLWSTGITLYHAATSQLPFMPYNYKRVTPASRFSLKMMYEKRKPGIISAKQNSDNEDDITWSDKLPDNCRLSPMLKYIAAKVIGDLMDPTEANTFERFFEQADTLAKKKRILVFNSYNGELFLLYLKNLTYDCIVAGITDAIGFPREKLILLTRNKVLEPMQDSNAACLRSLPVKGHLRYNLTDDTVLVVVKDIPNSIPTLTSKNICTDKQSKPMDKFEAYSKAKSYCQTLLSSIYQISYSANYMDCQLDCYLATMFSFNQYLLIDDIRVLHDSATWRKLLSETSCDTTRILLTMIEESVTNLDSDSTAFDDIKSCKVDINKLEGKVTQSDGSINTFYTRFVERREMFKFTEKTFYDISDAKSNDSLDFLVHLADELVNEMLVIPEAKLFKDDDVYKFEVWQRQTRLYEYYRVASERLTFKASRIKEAHKYFYNLSKTGLGLITNISTWKNHLESNENKRLNISTRFQEMINWWRKNKGNSTEKKDLQTKILEIKELTELLLEPDCDD